MNGEDWLAAEIAEQWGPAGAHTDVYRSLLAERDRIRTAAALLYGAHAELRLDTAADRKLHRRIIAIAKALWPGIEAAADEAAARGQALLGNGRTSEQTS